MKLGIRLAWCLSVVACWLLAGAAAAQNGVILDQDLNGSSQGYTVIRVWGTHYEMGDAQAQLLGDYIVDAVNETKALVGVLYNTLRGQIAASVWQPAELEDELDGMVDALAISHPSAGIDKVDLKVMNTYGDWGYACRSHICWGRYVAPPVKTLATRRLDFGSPMPTANHHVLLARDPGDGSPRWVNLAWPGAVATATGVNEFGTLVSLHDYGSGGADVSAGRMPRMVAARHALTFAAGDVSTHLGQVFSELQLYEIMTGGFVNYYAPQGHGGVMTAHPYQSGSDFYHLRSPQAVWHHGEAMITTNAWTDGTTTPSDEDFGADTYYGDQSPKTLESHWNLLAGGGNALHQLSVAYRGHGDMTLWADGRMDGSGRTPRLEWDWGELFGPLCADGIDNDADGTIDSGGGPGGEPADPGCADELDLSERDPTLVCDDGADNDGDGGFDFDTETAADPGDQSTLPAGSGDPGCRNPSWSTESPKCQDGIDNDGDGAMDYDAGLSSNGIADGAGPDPQCVDKPDRNCEAGGCRSCGLGIELLGLMPVLIWLSRRRRP
jgi:hypothetical protein